MEQKYAQYTIEQAVALLAIDSPTGFTENAAQWVYDAFTAAGVDEHGVWPPAVDLFDETRGKIHVVDGVVHLWLEGNEALPPHDDTRIVAEACDIDSEDFGCALHILRVVRLLTRCSHGIDGDEDVVSARREIAVELLPDGFCAHVFFAA